MTSITITLTAEEAELLASTLGNAQLNPAHRRSLVAHYANKGDMTESKRYEKIAIRHEKKLELYRRILSDMGDLENLAILNKGQVEARKELGYSQAPFMGILKI